MPTKIGWTQETWNPFVGCSHVSPGCSHCYAERIAQRGMTPLHKKAIDQETGKWIGMPFEATKDVFEKPGHWRKPRMIFVCSMSDLFHERLTDQQRALVFNVMANRKHHTFQVLTKRPRIMRDYIVQRIMNGFPVLPNVWLGVTAENQEQADIRIPLLLDTPAAKRFVSVEPILEPLDLFNERKDYLSDLGRAGAVPVQRGLDWVICGGESGYDARPMNSDWARSLRDQCTAAGVPFFFKQMTKKAPIPEDLQIQEFPHG